jgi:hypothetical protein
MGAEKGIAKAMLSSKVAQAILLAKHAYDTEEELRKETGLTKFRLIEYKPEDAQVRVATSQLSAVCSSRALRRALQR